MRLREYTDTLPKALVPIGPFPVVLHVMRIYASYGFRRFILCLGYRGDMIKQYFMDHEWISHDFILKMGPTRKKEVRTLVAERHHLDYEITFADTGLDTPTGGRVKKIEKYIETENFHVTYCDSLADIDIRQLTEYHKRMGKIGTVTAVHVMSPFGIIDVDNTGIATSFKEKPALPGYINGGYLVFKKAFFKYLTEKSILEEDPLRIIASKNQLAAYRLEKFWACMDTFKDVERLNALWDKGYMPNTGFRGRPPWVRDGE